METVLGSVETSTLGHVQPHEHLFVRATAASESNPALCIDNESLSIAELQDYRAAGGGTVVDCQPIGAGRNLFALRRLSLSSGVTIIGVTGYHLPIFYPSDHWIHFEDEGAMKARFLRDLREGVTEDGHQIRPGAVKAAIGREGLEGRFGICLRAAAGAAAEVGVPLILHTEAGAGAVNAITLCEHMGLSPADIAVCHVDRQVADYSIHTAVAKTGVYLEYDTIGRWKYHDDRSECALLMYMLECGYEKQMLLSLDTTANRLKHYGGTPGLCYILGSFLPMLHSMGVSNDITKMLTQENPVRLFE